MWNRTTELSPLLKSDDGIAHFKLLNFWTVTSYTSAHTHMHGPTHMKYTHKNFGTGYVPILKQNGSEAPI
jgi:hypothetical protein